MNATRFAVVLLLLVSGFAYAESSNEAQTKLKIEETKEKNKVDGDIDQEITNARMRADSGSKSRYSLSTGLSYTGGAIKSAFGTNRPNLSGEPNNQVSTSANVDLNARYRWSKNNSITFGTSVGMYTPFQGNVRGGNQTNWSNPTVMYNRVGKLGDFQATAKVGGWVGTSQEAQTVKNNFGGSMSYSLLYAFQNRWTLGTTAASSFFNYTDKPGKNQRPTTRTATYGGDLRTQLSAGLFPFAEYAFNDTFSFRTVFGYFNWRHLYGDANRWRMLKIPSYQSVGVGISVARDVYLYPNVQFLPDNIRSDFTNVAMTATLNVF